MPHAYQIGGCSLRFWTWGSPSHSSSSNILSKSSNVRGVVCSSCRKALISLFSFKERCSKLSAIISGSSFIFSSSMENGSVSPLGASGFSSRLSESESSSSTSSTSAGEAQRIVAFTEDTAVNRPRGSNVSVFDERVWIV